MQRAHLENYRAMLIAKRDEILRGSRHHEDIRIVQTTDPIDTVQLAGERDFTVRILEGEARLLREVEAAVGRIGAGVYGTCLECDEPISCKRLAVVPWASYCLKCQELHDRHHQRDSRHVVFGEIMEPDSLPATAKTYTRVFPDEVQSG